MQEDDNVTFYDSDSSVYDKKRWRSKAGIFNRTTQERIVGDLTKQWDNRRIVEVGPGTARFTVRLATRGNRLTLVDISSGMLEVAERNIREHGLGDAVEQYVQCSIYDPPLNDGEFDCAICINVLSHLEDAGAAIRQLARLLKSGGSLLINVPNLQSYYWPVARRVNKRSQSMSEGVYATWKNPGEIKKALEEEGLQIVQCVGHVHVPMAMERYPVLGLIKMLDRISRSSPLRRVAPILFFRCQKT